MQQKSNFDKFPSTSVTGNVCQGWDEIKAKLKAKSDGKDRFVIVIECYQGLHHNELRDNFKQVSNTMFIDTSSVFKSEDEIRKMTYPDVTDDAIFGYMTRLSLSDFLDVKKMDECRKQLEHTKGTVIVYGHGASLVVPEADLLIYADMSRWEIQARMRKNMVDNIGICNKNDPFSEKYKRGFFVDWRICDNLKKHIWTKADYWLDTNKADCPKMVSRNIIDEGLEITASQPFRVVPFFDPGPWGGHWMKEKLDLPDGTPNYAWCFDCVPEENSLLLNVSGTIVEIPSINLALFKSKKLLGEPVESRFGQEFPIRFDFLDTMGGGNLSLQVHPNTQYIRDQFGMTYTQDESYYLLDAKEDAVVYLCLKKGINPEEMISDLEKAQEGEIIFDTDKYVNSFPAKKHDHFLIPSGTVHCSGRNSMVLEISSTPFIFTFKMWDWARLGLDGKPRPINIDHGSKVIDWRRDDDFAKKELINNIQLIDEGDGWREERTGLHENEFIETRRHWFSTKVNHNTGKSVNVLNLVEGDEAIVESPEGKFDPFVVHYAETFIVPASVGNYTIRPYGKSEGRECATIKAYVRFKS